MSRKSTRANIGIPPARFDNLKVMPTLHSPKNSQDPATMNTSTTSANATATSTAMSTATSTATSSKPHVSTNTVATNVQAQQKSANPHVTDTSADVNVVRREFEKRMADMESEFRRQMHVMQNLMVSNFDQMRDEIRRPPQNSVMQTNNSNTDAASSLESLTTHSLSESQNMHTYANVEREPHGIYSQNSAIPGATGSGHKKIYPLPTFTGTPEEWQTFYESFTTTTQEFDYSKLHNIMRLRDALKGNARNTVESLLGSSENVSAILDILKQTYGRPEQLIKSQIEKVRSIPAVREGNLEALVEFANKVANMTTYLKNAQGIHHLTNPMLLCELVSKLPVARQMQWAEKCMQLERPATIVDFSDWLATIRRLANIVSDSLPSTSKQESTYQPNRRQQLPTSRKFAGVVAANNCSICQKDCVSIPECKTFLSLTTDERWNKVKSLKFCFSCLKFGHQVQKCFFKNRLCGTNGCQNSHHKLLHRNRPEISQVETSSKNNNRSSEAKSSDGNETDINARNCHALEYRSEILFQILPIKIYLRGIEVLSYAFIDDGANVSMIDHDFAKTLGLSGKRQNLEIQWLNEKRIRNESEVVELTISGVQENAERFSLANLFTSKNLSLPRQSCHIEEIREIASNLNLEKLCVENYSNIQPKIILSLSHAYLTVPLEAPLVSSKGGPIAMKTRLGWVIYGPMHSTSISKPRVLHLSVRDQQDPNLENMNNMMKSYFEIETFGVKLDAKKVLAKNDERALQILDDTTRRSGERFECGLLWKENLTAFPDSFKMALHRLELVERKMSKDAKYAAEYCAKVAEYIAKGYARKLNQEEIERITEKTFYLPHFGVKNPNKPKLRLVFDAAAEIDSFSLNKALLAGPDLNQPLIKILFKFREAPIAVCGDIQEMFHQILTRRVDQDSQRFLWRNGDSTKPIETYVMERMIFGAACSPTVAQHIKNFNANQFQQQYPRAVKGIIEKHYVDDYVDCFESEKEAISTLSQVIKIHAAAGFVLRNIISNSVEITKEYGTNDEKFDCGNFVANGNSRILGMNWNKTTDIFCFNFRFHNINKEILSFSRSPTKREVLAVIMSVFDPFGFLANFVIHGKLLMQQVWKANIEWDQKLPENLFVKWKLWFGEMYKVKSFGVPRCYDPTFLNENAELHIFVDASEEAMAAVAYWRWKSGKSGFKIKFVCAKTSCAPLRFHSIPKLELQAAIMGVRLKNAIVENHSNLVKNFIFWTDSHTVVQWIRSDHRKYKQYVANRVAEILESSQIAEWRWCPGVQNPADEGTRARFPPKYNPEGRWRDGAMFLQLDENCWPTESLMLSTADDSQKELRKYNFHLKQNCVFSLNFNRFSNLSRLKRSMAWVFRYVGNLKAKINKKKSMTGELSAEELEGAMKFLCKVAQEACYADEIAALSNSSGITKNSALKTLNPFLKDELLRVGGRISKASCLSLEARHPIILPNSHRFTELLADYYHRKMAHINVSTVMSEIRQKYWVPSLRRVLNKVQSKCATCRFRRAAPSQPIMGELPMERLTPYVRPFAYTGLDLFGPVTVTIRRQKEKRWVALFTCLTVRAVHLELVTDLSSDACLVAIRNFVNRRGVPVVIRSDNGTNFVGIPKELQGCTNFLDNNKVFSSGLSTLGIRWKFNTPANPSEGGVWERLVQSVKKAMYAILKEHAPRLETLQSVLIEVENMVNARPLTHLAVTPEDPEPLTPNHFLLGCSNSTQTPAPFEPRLMCLRKQWRVAQNLKNALWHKWVREYLPELTRRTKWCMPSLSISVGSLVLMCDPDAPRSQWKRGRIVSLRYGSDKVARSAEVRTSSGLFRRPVSKLALLDCEASPGSVHGSGDVD